MQLRLVIGDLNFLLYPRTSQRFLELWEFAGYSGVADVDEEHYEDLMLMKTLMKPKTYPVQIDTV